MLTRMDYHLPLLHPHHHHPFLTPSASPFLRASLFIIQLMATAVAIQGAQVLVVQNGAWVGRRRVQHPNESPNPC